MMTGRKKNLSLTKGSQCQSKFEGNADKVNDKGNDDDIDNTNGLTYIQNHLGGAFGLNVEYDRSRNQMKYLYNVYAFLFLVILVR